jgi:predicted protein tyrosine phosphatase
MPAPKTAKTKLLFVCSRNKRRSLTAEKVLGGRDYDVRSCGTESGSRVRITEGHIGWADWIFVMEKKHLQLLRSKYADALQGKNIVSLHIPDDFDFMDEELIEILHQRVSEHIEIPD